MNDLRLRDYISADSADSIIQLLFVVTVVAPFIAASVAALFASCHGKQKRRASVIGFCCGFIVSVTALLMTGPLVREYWAG